MVRVAALRYGSVLLLIVLFTINLSGARPTLTNISEDIVWNAVTDPNEVYQDPETRQNWTTFKINIPAGNYNSSIKNDANENTSFHWKSDKKIGKGRLYRSIDFYKDNETNGLEYDPKTTIPSTAGLK